MKRNVEIMLKGTCTLLIVIWSICVVLYSILAIVFHQNLKFWIFLVVAMYVIAISSKYLYYLKDFY